MGLDLVKLLWKEKLSAISLILAKLFREENLGLWV